MVMKLRKFECSATYLYLKNTVSILSVLLLLIVSFLLVQILFCHDQQDVGLIDL